MFPDNQDFNDHGIIASVSYQDHPMASVMYNHFQLDTGTKTTMNIEIEEVQKFSAKI